MIEEYKIMQGWIKWLEGSSFPSQAILEPEDIHSNGVLGEGEQTKENISLPSVLLVCGTPCHDMVMASGLDAFKRGLDRFL